MRVGVFFPNSSPLSGGAYTFHQEMLKALVKLASGSHHHFTLFFDEVASINLTKMAEDNMEVVFLQTFPPPLSLEKRLLLAVIGKLGWKLKEKPKVLSDYRLQVQARERHIDLVWFPTSIYLPVEVPYMVTVWDIQHRLQPWFPEVGESGIWNSRETYYSAYLRRAAFILTPNEAGRRELSLFYQIPDERFCLLPHPTPLIEEIPSNEDVSAVLLKHQISAPYLFYPAQFWAHKNHINLLLALKILIDTYGMDFQLVLVGSDQGNKQYILNKMDEFGLVNNVRVLGFIPREDVMALYRGAFVLSYLTYFGPENLPPLEAFTLGCPVIASRVSGVEEQLGDAAFLVNGSCPEEIAEAIKKLYDNPSLRNSLISKGRAHATRFTSLDYVKAVFSLFDGFEPVRRNWES